MSIADCVNKLVATGKITRAIADEALGLFDRAKGEYGKSMGPASADAAAALAVARDMESGAKKLKYNASKQALGWANFEKRALEHKKGPVAGIMSQLTRDIWEHGGENVYTKSEVIFGNLAERFKAGMEAYKPGILGQSKEQLSGVKNMIREIFGAETGDATAKAASKGYTAAVEEAVARAKAAGHNFEANENWRVMQFWDSTRLRGWTEAGNNTAEVAFKQGIRDAIDKGGLTLWDRDTGKPAPAARHEAIIARAYNDIRTGMGTDGTFSRDMRTFQFTGGEKGAEAYLKLQGQFGSGDNIMGALTGHLNRMAREIALSEVIAPNHGAVIRAGMHMAREAEGKLATLSPKRFIRGLESAPLIERTYDVLTGKANAVEGPLLSGIFGALRSISTAAQLKGAIISSVPSDAVTAAFAANHVGMAPTRLLEGVFRELRQGGAETKAIASRIGVVAHSAMEYAHGYRYFQDQVGGPESFKWLATTMIRGQGLQAWTELIKRTFTMEMMGHLADHSGHSFDKLGTVNPALVNFLEKHQISPDEWNTIRKSGQIKVEGAPFLDSNAIADRSLREKLLGSIIEERAFAMLEPDARIRAITTGKNPQGTWMGEIQRSLFLFKSFSMTMAATHVMRIATQGPIESRIWNGVAFALFASLGGAAAMQTKNILYGKDPESMGNATFWAKAFMQGGALGIYGDLLNSSFSRSGRSPIADLAGPIGGVAEDVARLSSAQFRKLFDDKADNTTFKAELVKTARRYTPGTFYTKLAVDRLLFDQLQMLADSDYRGSFRRMEQRMKQDTGQEFWFRPGKTTPDRAPDLGRALTRQ